MAEAGRSLEAVLAAVSAELSELALTADQLGGVGLAELERWQAMDRLSQHLAGLATVLAGLAQSAPPWHPDLSATLNALNVAALADRLAGRADATDTDPGALELFDA